MCICLCVFVCVFLYLYLYLYLCICICICVFLFVYCYLCICICVFKFVYLYLCIYICEFVFVYLYLCIWTCIFLCVLSKGSLWWHTSLIELPLLCIWVFCVFMYFVYLCFLCGVEFELWKPAGVTCQPRRAATDPQVSRINARSLEFTKITQTEVGAGSKSLKTCMLANQPQGPGHKVVTVETFFTFQNLKWSGAEWTMTKK